MNPDIKTQRVDEGKTISLTASTSGITAGTPTEAAGIVAIPPLDIAASAVGIGEVDGVFEAVKDSSAITAGDKIGWDSDGNAVNCFGSNGCATSSTSAANFWMGFATIDAGSAAETVKFRLNGKNKAAHKADLTDNTGGTAGTEMAAITAGSTYAEADMLAVKNGLATLTARLNEMYTFFEVDGAKKTS